VDGLATAGEADAATGQFAAHVRRCLFAQREPSLQAARQRPQVGTKTTRRRHLPNGGDALTESLDDACPFVAEDAGRGLGASPLTAFQSL